MLPTDSLQASASSSLRPAHKVCRHPDSGKNELCQLRSEREESCRVPLFRAAALPALVPVVPWSPLLVREHLDGAVTQRTRVVEEESTEGVLRVLHAGNRPSR